ncbi:serine/threonine-protein kinase [Streptomyces griseus]|uniref:serine/threonine-protein kinase n=1 Tax=Streptomyces griseus TaxID=1911 RepID=UPI000561641A|nr:serine/threonine-protein kinase [Streptomyces griseus]
MSSGEHGQTAGAGRLLAGRYRVAAQLGRGGMGVVWRAVDEVLGREVAVKELRAHTAADGPELDGLRLRMQREARAAARVRHPGVVAVHDIAEVDGRPLIVMELVDGPSLDDALRDRGPLDPREVAGIGAKVMDALSAAHAAGVLHRDVKPGNILLDRSGRVVLTDFGIATMEDPDDGWATRLTRSGELVGSLEYLAPERAQGADPGPASDIWSLGATLFAAVEGSSPFRRTSTYSTLTAIVTEPVPEPRRAGPLAPVLHRLLDKRAESRPEAAEARALLEAVASMAVPDTPTAALRGAAAPPRRRETELDVPAGAAAQGAAGSAPPASPAAPPTGAMAAPVSPRRRIRASLPAVAVAVVLLAGGTTVALLNEHNAREARDAAASPKAFASPSPKASSASPSARTDADPTEQGAEETPGGGGAWDPRHTGAATPTGRPPTTSAPTPSCTSIGGGKYNCQVSRTAKSYTFSGTEVGVLRAGRNYFYCQRNLGRRETYGAWTNVWWAKTDDDSGNTDVYVSDVYIKGGDNDSPVPGLPVC